MTIRARDLPPFQRRQVGVRPGISYLRGNRRNAHRLNLRTAKPNPPTTASRSGEPCRRATLPSSDRWGLPHARFRFTILRTDAADDRFGIPRSSRSWSSKRETALPALLRIARAQAYPRAFTIANFSEVLTSSHRLNNTASRSCAWDDRSSNP